MKITKIETFQIETPRYYQKHPVDTGEAPSGHVIVKLHVADGLVGLGEASDSKAGDLGALTKRYNDLLVGRDATRITEINELVRAQDFGSTVSNSHLTAAIDIALYDLNGKAQGVPAHNLMGGKVRESVYFCYPIIGAHLEDGFERNASYLQRLVDLGHHLFRYYVSGDSDLDNRFITEMKARFGDKIKLKAFDFSGRFSDWETALRYADVLRHHNPYNFEQPSNNLRVCAEFVKRMDTQVSLHISSLEEGYEAIERGACTVLNLAWVWWGPTYVRRMFALAEAAGFKTLLSTDQDSTLGTAGAVHLGVSVPNLDIPADPAGPLLYTVSPAKVRIRAEESHLYPPEGPGLGVELDEDKMRELTIASA
jgi:muconate cycloisomerase